MKVLFLVAGVLAQICVKNHKIFTPEKLIDQVICKNSALRHQIFEKVSESELFRNLTREQ